MQDHYLQLLAGALTGVRLDPFVMDESCTGTRTSTYSVSPNLLFLQCNLFVVIRPCAYGISAPNIALSVPEQASISAHPISLYAPPFLVLINPESATPETTFFATYHNKRPCDIAKWECRG